MHEQRPPFPKVLLLTLLEEVWMSPIRWQGGAFTVTLGRSWSKVTNQKMPFPPRYRHADACGRGHRRSLLPASGVCSEVVTGTEISPELTKEMCELLDALQ